MLAALLVVASIVPSPDLDPALVAAVNKLEAEPAYSFEVERHTEGGPVGEADLRLSGSAWKDKGARLQLGEEVAWRVGGETLVHRDGAWTKLEGPFARFGREGRGGRAERGEGEPRGERGERGEAGARGEDGERGTDAGASSGGAASGGAAVGASDPANAGEAGSGAPVAGATGRDATASGAKADGATASAGTTSSGDDAGEGERGGRGFGRRGGGRFELDPAQRAELALERFTLPAERFGDLEHALVDVERIESEHGLVFRGRLSPEAARSLAPGGGRGPRGGMQAEGKLEFHLDAQGALTECVQTLHLSMGDDPSMEVTSTEHVRFGTHEPGEAGVPAEVLEAAGAKQG